MADGGKPSAEASQAFKEGAQHLRDRRWADALATLDRACLLHPNWLAAEANRGVALRALGRFEDAVAAYDRALAIKPDDAPLLKNRANAVEDHAVALRTQGRAAEALAFLGEDPGNPRLKRIRANLLIDLGRDAEALSELDAVIAQAPDADAHVRKGLVLQRGGWHAEAIAAFDMAADHPDAPMFRSFSSLALGSYRDGWRGFEQRWQAPAFENLGWGQVTPALRDRLTLAPTREALAGRRLLVVGEQGIGDVLMFAGAIPDALTDRAEITLVCEPRLRRLFAASWPGVTFAEGDVDLSPFDHVLAIGSLCAAYRAGSGDFTGGPYLTPSGAARAAAAARLGPKAKPLRIGLSWRGGGALTKGAGRSIPLADLAPLLAISDAEFVSLQYGDQSDAAGVANLRVLDPATIADFDDLAATVLEMDLIVSVQTALIHLSGALGAPCRVMVPHVAEWRYGQTGETMPWYGSVRLIRQGADGDWAPVIRHVAAELRALI